MLRFTKFAIPNISGAGFYSGSGPLPRPRPLTTVIGSPVRVVKWSGSTNEPAFEKAVNELHERYCDALKVRGWAQIGVRGAFQGGK